MGKYTNEYTKIHKSKKYGVSGNRLVEPLAKIIDKESKSILDYGAGQADTARSLGKELGIKDVKSYDPSVEGRNVLPDRDFDTVICTDVLEHVPEEELPELFTTVWGLADKEAIFVIALRLAGEILPCGDNAHCTVQPKEWWEKQLSGVWENVEYLPQPPLSKKFLIAAFKVS